MKTYKKEKHEKLLDGKVISYYRDTMNIDGKTVYWDMIHHSGASAVLAILDNGKLLLEKQYRGPFEKYLIEIPAGKKEENEEFLSCAKRELEEETGYICDDLKKILTIYPTVAVSDEIIKIYLATNLKKGNKNLDDDEDVEMFELTLSEALEKINKAEIVDSKTVSAILWYANYLKSKN